MQAGRPVERVDAGVAGDEDAFGVDPPGSDSPGLAASEPDGTAIRGDQLPVEFLRKRRQDVTGAQTGSTWITGSLHPMDANAADMARRRPRCTSVRPDTHCPGAQRHRTVAVGCAFRAAAQIGEQLIEGIPQSSHQTVDGVIRPADLQVDVGGDTCYSGWAGPCPHVASVHHERLQLNSTAAAPARRAAS